jgi:Flp pilus assembly protein TadD
LATAEDGRKHSEADSENGEDSDKCSKEYSEKAGRENPNVPALYNNRAFALISLGRYEEASTTLTKAMTRYPHESVGALAATAGLVFLRTGRTEEGKQKYREAISLFKRTGNPVGEALALAYFAQEAARAELPEASAIVEEIKRVAKNLKNVPEVPILVERAQMWLHAVAQRRAHSVSPVGAV